MRFFVFKFLFFFLGFAGRLDAQLTLYTWNIQNLGRSKSDSEIVYMASVLSAADVVAIQEVVAGKGGAQAVARLADELNRMGHKWDYVISDPTTTTAHDSERYAFLWKTSKFKKHGDAWLDTNYRKQMAREPFMIRLVNEERSFTLVSFHALPKSKQPETEIKYLKFFKNVYKDSPLIFCGDFNCPQSHTVFNPLKEQGYAPALKGQCTTLKQQCKNGNCLASEYDNVFYPIQAVQCFKSGIVEFYREFPDCRSARQISDHLPVFFEFGLK